VKAITYSSYGGPEVLELSEVAEPKVGPDSVLVQVRATSVNPVDWKVREGSLDGALDTLQITADDTVLIHAASGGVGSLATQIAVACGARVIGTASERNHDYLRSLGAEPVTYGEGLAERVNELAPTGVSAVLDLVGGAALTSTAEVLAPKGRVASVADPGVTELGGHYVFVRPDAADLAALVELVEQGKVTVEVAETYPLAETAAAHTASEQGHTRGKIAVRVDQ
jgi:NADPH:quinone reductase-like Zn-dependent oxidoreductase